MELKMQDAREHARQLRIMAEEEAHTKTKKMSAAQARADFNSYFDNQVKVVKPKAVPHAAAAAAARGVGVAAQAKKAAEGRLRANLAARAGGAAKLKQARAPPVQLQQWPGAGAEGGAGVSL